MKLRRFLLPAFVATSVMTITSCTKNYTCQCSIQYSGYPGLPDSTTVQYTITDTRTNAQNKCQNQSATYNNNGIKSVETCVLF